MGDSHNQVFCGNLAKSVVAWEPPDTGLIPKVHLNSHTGWVRALATSRQWLFRFCAISHLLFIQDSMLLPARNECFGCWQNICSLPMSLMKLSISFVLYLSQGMTVAFQSGCICAYKQSLQMWQKSAIQQVRTDLVFVKSHVQSAVEQSAVQSCLVT